KRMRPPQDEVGSHDWLNRQRFTSSEEGADALAREGVGTDGGSSELRPTSRDMRPRSQRMPSRADTPAHQIRTRSSGLSYTLSPGFTPQATYRASMLRIGPSIGKRGGEWGSVVTCCLSASGRVFPRQTWAQPRNTRCTPVKPSRTASGSPWREAI